MTKIFKFSDGAVRVDVTVKGQLVSWTAELQEWLDEMKAETLDEAIEKWIALVVEADGHFDVFA